MLVGLEPEKYYHIYNRGINSCNLFNNEHDYEYFEKLIVRYLSSISDIYAYAIMSNHFHFVIKFHFEIAKPPHQYFSNLFNAYTKAFNIWNKRHGSLFERPFRRKLLNDEFYLKNAIHYVNYNPAKHGLVKDITKYKYASFSRLASTERSNILVDYNEIYEIFGGKDEFFEYHNSSPKPI